MGDTEPQSTDSNEFGLRLQQVFSAATRRLRQALEREAIDGGIVQGFIGAGIIQEPTIAFKLRETSPKIVDRRLSTGEWIVHVPLGETGDTFLTRFWLERVVRVTDSRTSTTLEFNENGSTPVGYDDTLIGPHDLVDLPGSTDMVLEPLIGLEAAFEEKADNLGRIARSMDDDFELVPFNS